MENTNSTRMLIKLLRVSKKIHQATYHLDFNHKLYPGQPQMLGFLKHFEGISQKELSKKHEAAPASITGMLQKLEKQELIYRTPDEKDKRILRVYLTPKGKEIAEKAGEFFDTMSEELFKNFTDEERNNYNKLMDKLFEKLLQIETERRKHENV